MWTYKRTTNPLLLAGLSWCESSVLASPAIIDSSLFTSNLLTSTKDLKALTACVCLWWPDCTPQEGFWVNCVQCTMSTSRASSDLLSFSRLVLWEAGMTARGLSLKSQASVWVVSPSWPVVSPRTHSLSVVRPCQPPTALSRESEPPHFYVIFGRTVGSGLQAWRWLLIMQSPWCWRWRHHIRASRHTEGWWSVPKGKKEEMEWQTTACKTCMVISHKDPRSLNNKVWEHMQCGITAEPGLLSAMCMPCIPL